MNQHGSMEAAVLSAPTRLELGGLVLSGEEICSWRWWEVLAPLCGESSVTVKWAQPHCAMSLTPARGQALPRAKRGTAQPQQVLPGGGSPKAPKVGDASERPCTCLSGLGWFGWTPFFCFR